MKILRLSVSYGIAIAAAAFALGWLEFRHTTHFFSTEIYIVIIAIFFAGLGIWVGSRVTGKSPLSPFEKNTAALDSLGITDREYDVLCLLEQGLANKEIASSLHISLNTVKTHLGRLYEKLQVSTRTQAIRKAKSLRLIA